jgi:hypothetical protein
VISLKSKAIALLGVIALVIGGASTLWMIGMVHQWLIPWSSLAVLAPPR